MRKALCLTPKMKKDCKTAGRYLSLRSSARVAIVVSSAVYTSSCNTFREPAMERSPKLTLPVCCKRIWKWEKSSKSSARCGVTSALPSSSHAPCANTIVLKKCTRCPCGTTDGNEEPPALSVKLKSALCVRNVGMSRTSQSSNSSNVDSRR